MTGRRAIVGLSLLSALLFCAFAAQSASAALKTSKNTTAFTCVKDAAKTGDFTDAHCDVTGTIGKSEFKHELISLNTTTEFDFTNSAVTESTKKSEPLVFRLTVAASKSEIECTTIKGNVTKSTLHNTEPEPKTHTFTGTAVVELSNCTVKQPTKCIVAEPIVIGATIHGVEGMKGPKGEPNAMGVEFVGHGVEETLTEFEYLNKGAEKCALNAKRFPLKGKLIATSGPATDSPQENKESGATLVFTPKFEMEELILPPNVAEVEAIFTLKMAGGGNPIALTTTT